MCPRLQFIFFAVHHQRRDPDRLILGHLIRARCEELGFQRINQCMNCRLGFAVGK
jgi:hypothetical protein